MRISKPKRRFSSRCRTPWTKPASDRHYPFFAFAKNGCESGQVVPPYKKQNPEACAPGLVFYKLEPMTRPLKFHRVTSRWQGMAGSLY
jgi:hypothetical protein